MKLAKQRNFVAKHAPHSGAGQHKDKTGEFASRARQKQNFLKEIRNSDEKRKA